MYPFSIAPSNLKTSYRRIRKEGGGNLICSQIYGIWADTNGDDGPPVVGEASISLATACYGTEAINGNSGHDESDVLYVAFTGEDALPGPRTKWDAKDFKEFEDSIEEVGNRLIERLK